jgi:hypothetical protein
MDWQSYKEYLSNRWIDFGLNAVILLVFLVIFTIYHYIKKRRPNERL